MRLYELFNPKSILKSRDIVKHQAEIKHDVQQAPIKAGKIQDIQKLFKLDPKTAWQVLDTEARQAELYTKHTEKNVEKEIENEERERVLQLVQSISDISAYEETQLEVDRLVAQYMRNRK